MKFPTLTTARLTLRPFTLGDAKEVQRQAGNYKVYQTTGTIPHPYPDGHAETWIGKHQDWFEKGISVDWAVTVTDTQTLVGCMSLMISAANKRAELGYWIGEEFWNKGYGTESAQAAIDYGFKVLNLSKVTSRYVASNVFSGKVMQKAGMEQEGYLKRDFVKDGVFHDTVVYGLLNPDYKAE